MESADGDSINYIDGIAVHYYGNFVPPELLDDLQNRYNKILIATEACEGNSNLVEYQQRQVF